MFFPRKFLKKTEGDAIVESIVKAEEKTSGEIRVHFQSKISSNILDDAVKTFYKLEMDKTKYKNGVLVFVVPKSKQFSIIGDEGINEKVPDGFWDEMLKILEKNFKQSKMKEGLCQCVEVIGEQLKEYFPIELDDKNELSNEISFS